MKRIIYITLALILCSNYLMAQDQCDKKKKETCKACEGDDSVYEWKDGKCVLKNSTTKNEFKKIWIKAITKSGKTIEIERDTIFIPKDEILISIISKSNENQIIKIRLNNDGPKDIYIKKDSIIKILESLTSFTTIGFGKEEQIIEISNTSNTIEHKEEDSANQDTTSESWFKSSYLVFSIVFLGVLGMLIYLYPKYKRKNQSTNKAPITTTPKSQEDTAQSKSIVSLNAENASQNLELSKEKIEKELMIQLSRNSIPAHLKLEWEKLLANLINNSPQTFELQTLKADVEKKAKEILEVNAKWVVAKTYLTNSENSYNTLFSQSSKKDEQLKEQEIQLTDKENQIRIKDSQLKEKALEITRMHGQLEDLKPYSEPITVYINALRFAYKQLKEIEDKADKRSKFYQLIGYILDGYGTKVSNAVFDIVKPNETLIRVLGVNSAPDLKNISKEVFFAKYVNNFSEKTLTNIAQTYAYANAGYPLNLSVELDRAHLSEIKSVYYNLEKAINELGYSIILPNLGVEDFDPDLHLKSNNSTLMQIDSEKIDTVLTGKIYDIVRIGFKEISTGNIITKTTVVCKL